MATPTRDPYGEFQTFVGNFNLTPPNKKSFILAVQGVCRECGYADFENDFNSLTILYNRAPDNETLELFVVVDFIVSTYRILQTSRLSTTKTVYESYSRSLASAMERLISDCGITAFKEIAEVHKRRHDNFERVFFQNNLQVVVKKFITNFNTL